MSTPITWDVGRYLALSILVAALSLCLLSVCRDLRRGVTGILRFQRVSRTKNPVYFSVMILLELFISSYLMAHLLILPWTA